ncbi:MAG: Spy/CpxP family protein refolding chaperone [Armatimonadota bacterium]
MKRKIWIFAAVAVALGVVAVAGQTAFAQGGRGCFRHGGAQLNLTKEQRQQAKAIFGDTQSRMKQVLTPEQQQQFQRMRKQRGQRFRSLTDAQKAQMKSIREDARTKAQAIKAEKTLSAQERQTRLGELRKATREQMRQVLPAGQQRKANLTPEQREKMQAVRQEGMTRFRAILTPDQQAKFDQGRTRFERNRKAPTR